MKISPVLKLKVNDNYLIFVLSFGFIYYWYGEPMVMRIFAASVIATTMVGKIVSILFADRRINIRYCLIAALAITFCLSYQTATHAVIFESLETAMEDAVEATGGAVDEEAIGGFFTIMRVIIGIGFIVGITVAIVRATSGNDWAPIATALGIAIFGVISIEVMSNLLLGEGGDGEEALLFVPSLHNYISQSRL